MTDYGAQPPPEPEPEESGRWLADAIQSSRPPAIALQWYGIISMLLAGLVVALFLAAPGEAAGRYYDRLVQQQRELAPEDREQLPPRDEFVRGMQIQWVGIGIIWLVCSFLIAYGGIRMKQLHGYGWAVTGAILSAIPCISGCCCFGTPIGLWALVTLFGSDVRLGFARVAPVGGLGMYEGMIESGDFDPPSRPIRLE